MTNSLNKLRDLVPTDVFTDTEVALALRGTPDSRHGVIKRALADGTVIQLRRGVYVFGKQYQRQPINLLALAQKIYPPSYISLESALSHYGLIPEATYTTTSVTGRRSKDFSNRLGDFSFTRIPGFNYVSVERLKTDGDFVLIASPSKALIDYVLCHKIEPCSFAELCERLRLDEGFKSIFSLKDLSEVIKVQPTKHLKQFFELWIGEVD